jgi:endonuclease G, mitochondrial
MKRQRSLTLLILVSILLCAALFIVLQRKGTVPADSAPVNRADPVMLPAGLEIPRCSGTRQPPETDHEIRHMAAYTLCYRESYEEAEWSAYELTVGELIKDTVRSNDFRPDPGISTGSASLSDYRGSGYDRGHLTPAADMAFNKTAMSESFYLSNMVPQTAGCNRGIWKELEEFVRTETPHTGRIYVISGPVLEHPAAAYKSIGKNNVAVPEYLYKVLLAPRYADETDAATPDDAAGIMAVGFIIPNRDCTGSIWDYAVTVDTVEARTGLDFYSLLDDAAENEAEQSFSRNAWQQSY